MGSSSAAWREDWAAFQRRWGERERLFRRHAPPPHWEPGLAITPALRRLYERFLPLDEWLRDLAALARRRLPDRSWLPRPLRDADGHGLADEPGAPPWPALPDLWRELPPSLAGRVTFTEAELAGLWRALANPARFGTGFGRYPAQLERIRARGQRLRAGAESATASPLRLLDAGCGTGEGTAEAAAAFAAAAGRPVAALGLTWEPLEVQMALERRPQLQAAAGGGATLDFRAGDVLAPPAGLGRFDLVLVNGLVGGPYLERDDAFRALLAALAPWLRSPHGRALLAQRFHAGRQAAVARFAALARQHGWQVAGSLADLELAPPGGTRWSSRFSVGLGCGAGDGATTFVGARRESRRSVPAPPKTAAR
ncbi:MAG: hypothetical protein WC789_06630 [Lentisphaeria bacterium]|jgi:SAM-dependent methyltransferase